MTTTDSDQRRFDAFISYSTNDNEWVNRYLVPILQSWGLTAAIDTAVFLPGTKLDDHISGFLAASRHVLFVCTEHFMRSRWCQDEVERVRDGSKILIPLELDGPDNVPQVLKEMEVTWCKLTERQHEDGQWRKLCQAMGGSWSEETDRVLDDLRDLGSFFGGFMNNRTITNIVTRSHKVTKTDEERREQYLTGVQLDHMLGADQIQSLAPIYTLLGRIGKVSRIEALLSNTYGELSREISGDCTENYIAVGGTLHAGVLLDKLCGYSWNDIDELRMRDHTEKFNWDSGPDRCFIYKSKTRVDENLLFLFSPWGLGTQEAAQILLEDYWDFARHVKEQEMLRVFDASGEMVREIVRD